MKATERLWLVARGGVFFIGTLTALFIVVTRVERTPAAPLSLPAPVFSVPGGYYDRDVSVALSVPYGDNVQIIFTRDGSVPSLTNGFVYTQPLYLDSSIAHVATLRARAFYNPERYGDRAASAVSSASYFVGIQSALPLISLIMDPADLWDLEEGLYYNYDERDTEWERPVHITYAPRDHTMGFALDAGLRIHGGSTRRYHKKSFRLYFRGEYGTSRLEYPLFPYSPVRSYKRLVLSSGGSDTWNTFSEKGESWTLIRKQVIAKLTMRMNSAATYGDYTLLFLNGELWGIYHLREFIDDSFLETRYGITDADLFDGKRGMDMGDSAHWEALYRFIATHPLSDPTHYAYVREQINIANFIDYTLLQIYSVNNDWPQNNVKRVRPRVPGGQWFWMLWDTDYALAGNADFDQLAWALFSDEETWCSSVDNVNQLFVDFWGKGASKVAHKPISWCLMAKQYSFVLRELLKNDTFKHQFITRAADLLNTVLTPESVLAEIDAQAQLIAPDIRYETVRWVKKGADWERNVAQMREFARQRPDFMRARFVHRFKLAGTAPVTFAPPVEGEGYIIVNGFAQRNLPWQGVYFLNTTIQVTAVPAPGYTFAGWDDPSLDAAQITLTVETTRTLAPRFIPAPPAAPRSGDVIFTAYAVNDTLNSQGDWLELEVTRPNGVDLRGWRITDNDTKTATDEGSLIFVVNPAFAHVPKGTVITIIATETPENEARFPQDDLDYRDGRMLLYVGNGHLDTAIDPGFGLSATNDNLVLLAPGATAAWGDDVGIDFVAEGRAVTPASFGVPVVGGSVGSMEDKSVAVRQDGAWYSNASARASPTPDAAQVAARQLPITTQSLRSLSRRVGPWLRQNTAPDDTVFTTAPELLGDIAPRRVLSMTTFFATTAALAALQPDAPGHLEGLLSKDKPDYCVTPRDMIWSMLQRQTWFEQYFQEHYEIIHIIDDPYYSIAPITIWRRVPRSVRPRRALRVQMPHGIELLGYQIDATSKAPGETLYTDLIWRAAQPVPITLTVVVSMYHSLRRTVQLAADNTPAEHLATTQWQVSAIVTDTYALAIPADFPPGLYTLDVALFKPGQNQPLMPRALPLDSTGWVKLCDVRVKPRVDLAQNPPAHARTAYFGEAIEFLGYDAPARAAPQAEIPLVLYWRVREPVPKDYTVFTHLMTAEERWGGQHDGWPVNGLYPTSIWLPGEVIRDPHTILVNADAAPGVYELKIGLYDHETGERLPVRDAAGADLPGQTITLQPIIIEAP